MVVLVHRQWTMMEPSLSLDLSKTTTIGEVVAASSLSLLKSYVDDAHLVVALAMMMKMMMTCFWHSLRERKRRVRN